jgi:hypothetical protein
MKSLETKILKLYGKRCKDRCSLCPVCQVWRLYDQLMLMIEWNEKDWDSYEDKIRIKKKGKK